MAVRCWGSTVGPPTGGLIVADPSARTRRRRWLGRTCSSLTNARTAVSSIPVTEARAAVRRPTAIAIASSSSSSSGGIAAPARRRYPRSVQSATRPDSRLSSGPMGEATVRKLLPLYFVVFVGFLGYSLMIAVFTPMILRNDNGMLAASSGLSQRSLVLGVLLALYPLGQFLGSPVLG